MRTSSTSEPPEKLQNCRVFISRPFCSVKTKGNSQIPAGEASSSRSKREARDHPRLAAVPIDTKHRDGDARKAKGTRIPRAFAPDTRADPRASTKTTHEGKGRFRQPFGIWHPWMRRSALAFRPSSRLRTPNLRSPRRCAPHRDVTLLKRPPRANPVHTVSPNPARSQSQRLLQSAFPKGVRPPPRHPKDSFGAGSQTLSFRC